MSNTSQLKMEKNDLHHVPDIVVPDEYVLRTYQPGDETGLSRVYGASDLGMDSPQTVREKIIGHPCFSHDRVFVVEHAGGVVGTAAAWVNLSDPGVGYLHMVGTLPEHRGKGLGKALVIAAIEYTRNEGLWAQRLDTDDFRESAIRLYLDLGYYPLYMDETHPQRWETLAKKLDRPGLLVRARRG